MGVKTDVDQSQRGDGDKGISAVEDGAYVRDNIEMRR